MKRLSLLMIAAFGLAGFLGGCNKDDASSPAPPADQVKPPVAQVAPPVTAEAEPPVEEARYVYPVEGRRDPFVPLVATKKTATEFGNPLEAFDLPQFVVKAVIVGLGDTKAMVAAPDGKSYILRKGMRIGKASGVVRDINRERVLVEERYQDMNGKVHSNIQELVVPKREGV